MIDSSRPNTALAVLVERCIILAASNRARAADLMAAHGVPDRVIARVPSESARRRPAIASTQHQ